MKEIKIYRAIFNDGWFGDAGYVEEIVDQIKEAEGDDILLRMSTPGGSVFQGRAIITHLKEHTGKVNAIVDSAAISMGGVMLAFADHVIADEDAFIMLHKAYGGGNAELLMTINKQIAKSFKKNRSNNPKFDAKAIDKIFLSKDTGDYWFTAREAEKIGLVDKVTTNGATSLVAEGQDFIEEYYSHTGDIKNKIINNNNEEEMDLLNKKEVQELEAKLEKAQDDLKNQTNDLSALEDEKIKLEKEIAELNKANTEETKTFEAQLKTANESIESLTNDLKTTNETIENDSKAVVELGKKYDNLLAQIKKTVTGFEVEDTQNGADGKNLPENYGRAARIREKQQQQLKDN